MLKVMVKRLEGTKWKPIPANQLMNTSISRYMYESEDRIVAAMFEDDVPKLFLVNNQEDKEKYAAKGLTIHIADFVLMFNADETPPIVLKIFPDSFFESVEVIPKKEEKEQHKQWW